MEEDFKIHFFENGEYVSSTTNIEEIQQLWDFEINTDLLLESNEDLNEHSR